MHKKSNILIFVNAQWYDNFIQAPFCCRRFNHQFIPFSLPPLTFSLSLSFCIVALGIFHSAYFLFSIFPFIILLCCTLFLSPHACLHLRSHPLSSPSIQNLQAFIPSFPHQTLYHAVPILHMFALTCLIFSLPASFDLCFFLLAVFVTTLPIVYHDWKRRVEYWVTRSSVRSFARTAHSFINFRARGEVHDQAVLNHFAALLYPTSSFATCPGGTWIAPSRRATWYQSTAQTCQSRAVEARQAALYPAARRHAPLCPASHHLAPPCTTLLRLAPRRTVTYRSAPPSTPSRRPSFSFFCAFLRSAPPLLPQSYLGSFSPLPSVFDPQDDLLLRSHFFFCFLFYFVFLDATAHLY